MAHHWQSNITQCPSDMPPAMLQQNQGLLQASLMNREVGSHSSMGSTGSSGNSFLDPGAFYSPFTSYVGSPVSEYNSFAHFTPSVAAPESVVHPESLSTVKNKIVQMDVIKDECVPTDSDTLPIFDIEKEGDPRILWRMYYDFVVTKTEAYLQLRPGYKTSKNYPSRINRQKVKGNKHPCEVPNCPANPFTRHYDLERHFRTVHKNNDDKDDKDTFYCDYARCDHKDPLRKDHCREHYREYHTEDLLKRGDPAINEFLSSRVDYVKEEWWRCGRCLNRVKANVDGWICRDCGQSCEPERQEWRNKAFAASHHALDEALDQANNVIGCGSCENAWLPHPQDLTGRLWVSCPSCQPGPQKTMQY